MALIPIQRFYNSNTNPVTRKNYKFQFTNEQTAVCNQSIARKTPFYKGLLFVYCVFFVYWDFQCFNFITSI